MADATGSGSSAFLFAADASGAADATSSGAASFSIAASAAGLADAAGSGAASFLFTASAISVGPVNFGTPAEGWTFIRDQTVLTFCPDERVWVFTT
jgi:hypothetical protein